MEKPELRVKDIDESGLSDDAKAIHIGEDNYLKMINPVYIKQLEALLNREPADWMSYETYYHCVELTKDPEGQPPFLGINMTNEYNEAFALLKLKLNPIITEMHISLSQTNDKSKLMNEANFKKHLKYHWKIDFDEAVKGFN